jgi:hypothetical protein
MKQNDKNKVTIANELIINLYKILFILNVNESTYFIKNKYVIIIILVYLYE